jgi:hypothetical protein
MSFHDIDKSVVYGGNPNLRKSNTPIGYSQEQMDEIQKCTKDYKYFVSHYVKIITLNHGLITFQPHDYQYNIMDTINDNRFTICKMPRQSGKSTTVVAYFLWLILFHPDLSLAIVANRKDLAVILLSKIRMAYEYLPIWMQQGIVEWNKGNTYNILFVDEFAHINNTQAEDFFNAAYPTISSGHSSKIILVSTPYGLNHFYKMWVNAEDSLDIEEFDDKTSLFVPVSVHWSDVPGRDDKWKKQEIMNTSPDQFAQEQECEFLGSANTLISPEYLRNMVFQTHVRSKNNFDALEEPVEKHEYIVVCDTSQGVEGDDSAFVVIDVTKMPYKLVAKYKDNTVSPIYYPEIIHQTAQYYNNAYVLVELNDVGGQVANILNVELQYENMFMTSVMGRAGQILGMGMGEGSRTQLGVKTTVPVKRIGCANIKTIIENDQLTIKDFDVIQQLSNFVRNKNSYEASDGEKDDLVMCLVLFGWLCKQDFFKELTSTDFRKKLLSTNRTMIDEDILPAPIVDTGMPDDNLVRRDFWSGYESDAMEVMDEWFDSTGDW